MEYVWIDGGVCSECKTPFDSFHLASKTTCSPKCRKRRERRQKEQHAAHILAMREIQKMRDGIKRRESLHDFRAQLQYLRDEINDLLLLANEPDAMARREMLEDRARRR